MEALVRGRAVTGFDINPLSILLTRAKTTPLYGRDRIALRQWASAGDPAGSGATEWSDARLRNAPEELVRVLAPFEAAIWRLSSPRQQDAARTVLLDAAQTAIDGLDRPKDAICLPPLIESGVERLLDGIDGLMDGLRGSGIRPNEAVYRRRILRLGAANEVAASRAVNRLCGRFGLVVTSPPYPGVHVLYHRWQVAGRSETPMAYWLANSDDGLGPKHYTMGGRSTVGDIRYFATIRDSWTAVRRLLKPECFVVQMIAFADEERQLPLYLDAMAEAGYRRRTEYEPADSRQVPNRRWYNRVKPERGGAKERLLVHQLGRSAGS